MSLSLRLAARLPVALLLAVCLLFAGCLGRSGGEDEETAAEAPGDAADLEPDGGLILDVTDPVPADVGDAAVPAPTPVTAETATVSTDLCGGRDGLLDLGIGLGRLRVTACV